MALRLFNFNPEVCALDLARVYQLLLCAKPRMVKQESPSWTI